MGRKSRLKKYRRQIQEAYPYHKEVELMEDEKTGAARIVGRKAFYQMLKKKDPLKGGKK